MKLLTGGTDLGVIGGIVGNLARSSSCSESSLDIRIIRKVENRVVVKERVEKDVAQENRRKTVGRKVEGAKFLLIYETEIGHRTLLVISLFSIGNYFKVHFK